MHNLAFQKCNRKRRYCLWHHWAHKRGNGDTLYRERWAQSSWSLLGFRPLENLYDVKSLLIFSFNLQGFLAMRVMNQKSTHIQQWRNTSTLGRATVLVNESWFRGMKRLRRRWENWFKAKIEQRTARDKRRIWLEDDRMRLEEDDKCRRTELEEKHLYLLPRHTEIDERMIYFEDKK